MKKLILAAFVAVASLSANAQVWVGGGLGFSSDKANSDAKATTSFNITPTIGYALSENLDVAAELDFQYDKDAAGESTNSFKVAPFARYTFAECGNVSFYVDGGVGMRFYKGGGSTLNIGVRPGIKYAASDKVCLAASLGYLGYKKDSDGGPSKLALDLDNAVKFGVYFKF